MEIWKKLNEWFGKSVKGAGRKKIVENAAIVIILGVIVIIAGNTLFGKDSKEDTPTASIQGEEVETAAGVTTAEKEALEKRMEAILSQIDGAGRVEVMVTYYASKEIVPAYDTDTSTNNTDEKATGGDTRNIEQSDEQKSIAYEEAQGGSKKPIILKELEPQVKGVVVVADGAGDASVKESLSRAVTALVEVPIHKIQIFERKK